MQVFYQLRAALRLLLILILLVIGVIIVLLSSLIPWRVGGAPIATLIVVGMVRAFMVISGIRYHCPDPDLVRQHAGMIFCNHTSFIDTLMVLYLTPTRFLSTKGVRKIPFIGQIAVAIDTVFVHRFNEASRTAVRTEIAESLRKRTYPPLTLFPEGKINSGDQMFPLRYGAFEIAQAEQITILPCVLVYKPLSTLCWYERDESLLQTTWQLLVLPNGADVSLIPLEPLTVAPDAVIPDVAEEVQGMMQAILDQSFAKD